MAVRRAIFIYSQELGSFRYPADNPLKTDRAGRVYKTLGSMGLLEGKSRRVVAPAPAGRTVLKKFHTARYLHALRTASQGKWDSGALRMGIGTLDCPIFDGLYDYAVLAAGGTVVGAELILSGQADIVFNTSGGYHHAGPELAAGFCYINDMAVACHVLVDAGKRVLYVDVDAHFGDGVAYGFYDRCDVMTISLHENPRTLFPGTGFEDEIGSGPGKGYCVNVPLPVGTFDEAYLHAFNEIVPPLAKAFAPDIVVFELGADALAGDPLAHLHLTNNTYVHVIERLLALDVPILATGGGGYNVENTVRAWALAWAVFCGENTEPGMEAALGGVMLQSTDWRGGLRDRVLAVGPEQRSTVMPAIERTVRRIKESVFAIHGLRT